MVVLVNGVEQLKTWQKLVVRTYGGTKHLLMQLEPFYSGFPLPHRYTFLIM